MNTLSTPRILLLLLGGAILNLAIALGCALWSSFPGSNQDPLKSAEQWPRPVSMNWPHENVLTTRKVGFGLTSIQAWSIRWTRKDPALVLSTYLEIAQSKPNGSDAQLADLIQEATTLLKAIQLSDQNPSKKLIEQVKSLIRESVSAFDEADEKQFNQLYLSLLDRNTKYSLFVLESGWPWRCLEAESRSDRSLHPNPRNSLPSSRFRSGVQLNTGRWIPLSPMWPSFCMNSLVFALALWPFTMAPSIIRRIQRFRAGQCPACGTPIGVDSECHECGQDLRDFWLG
ncbi:MAG: hypothetical protein O7G85_16325 [Planctomycetota bacterium]|nr:hypothetical protein [Planctomycetota bacterium]